MGIKKAYVAHNLSRKRFKEDVHRRRVKVKAKLWHGCYMTNWLDGEDEPPKEGTRKPHVKYFYRNGYAKFVKKHCNRRLRRSRYNTTIPQHGGYRKYTEFWWEID